MQTNSKQTNYFRIGSFIIAGISIIVIAIIVFGSGMLFRKVIYIETYFSESVQGLVEGSPVKYLGMEIGHVKEISAVDSVYELGRTYIGGTRDRYIYVKMAISPEFFVNKTEEGIKSEIAKDVAAGLRVKLALQGLTGNAYLELDFLDPKTHPPITITWEPENYYVPSTVSTLAYFSDNVQILLEKLKNIDVGKVADEIQNFFISANDFTNRANKLLQATNTKLINTANNAEHASQNLTALIEQLRAFPSHAIFGGPPPKLEPDKL